MRRYPDPDPLWLLLDEESVPQSLALVEPQERAQRLRYALISLAAGNHAVVAWALALSADPKFERQIERMLERVSDEAIEEMLRSAQRESRGAIRPAWER